MALAPVICAVCLHALASVLGWTLRLPHFLAPKSWGMKPSPLIELVTVSNLAYPTLASSGVMLVYVFGLLDEICRRVLEWNLTKELGSVTTVRAARVTFHWDATLLTMEDMRVKNFKGFVKPFVFQICYARARFNLWSLLFSCKKIIYAGEIHGWRCYIDQDPLWSGRLNIQSLAPQKHKITDNRPRRKTKKRRDGHERSDSKPDIFKGLEMAFGAHSNLFSTLEMLGDDFMTRFDHYVHITVQAIRRTYRVNPFPVLKKTESKSKMYSVGTMWIQGLETHVDETIWEKIFSLTDETMLSLEELMRQPLTVNMKICPEVIAAIGYNAEALEIDELANVFEVEIRQAMVSSLVLQTTRMARKMNFTPLLASLVHDDRCAMIVGNLGLPDLVLSKQSEPLEFFRRLSTHDAVRPLITALRRFLWEVVQRDDKIRNIYDDEMSKWYADKTVMWDEEEDEPMEECLEVAMGVWLGEMVEKGSFKRLKACSRTIPIEPIASKLARSETLRHHVASAGLDLSYLAKSSKDVTLGDLYQVVGEALRQAPGILGPYMSEVLNHDQERLRGLYKQAKALVIQIQHGSILPIVNVIDKPLESEIGVLFLEIKDSFIRLGKHIIVHPVNAIRMLAPLIDTLLGLFLDNLKQIPAIALTDEYEGWKYTISNVLLTGVMIDREDLDLEVLGLRLKNGAFSTTTCMGPGTVVFYCSRYRTYEVSLDGWSMENTCAKIHIPVSNTRTTCDVNSGCDSPAPRVLKLVVRGVSARLYDVKWSLKQCGFPFLSDSGQVNATLEDISITIDCSVRRDCRTNTTSDYCLSVEDDRYEIKKLEFQFHKSPISPVYNAAASLLSVKKLHNYITTLVQTALKEKVRSWIDVLSLELKDHWSLILELLDLEEENVPRTT